MTTYSAFQADFDPFVPEQWRISDYTNGAGWIDTTWTPDNVLISPGLVELRLDGRDGGGKRFSGAEMRATEDTFYGTYEVTMRPSGVEGVLSSFFLYTGAPFGSPTSEIDFEFLGGDTTEVLLSIHTPEGVSSATVDLGFDAAAGFHDYAFEWGPDSVTWYADGVELHRMEDLDIGMAAYPGRTHTSIWTGNNAFTGSPANNVDTVAAYASVSYTPRTAPVAIDDRVLVAQGGAAVVDVLANDGTMGTAPLASTVAIASGPSHGTVSVDPSTGAITYTPDAGFTGNDTFSYVASDGTEQTNAADVEMMVGYPVYATFTSGAEGFAYADDAFRGTAQPDYASGALGSGTLQVVLGGGSTKSAVTDISGGWSQAFTSAAGQSGTLTLRYRITLTSDLDEGEWGEVLVDVDGTEYAVALMEATDDDDEVLDSGFVDVTLDLGTLAGGSHVLTLGGFLNQRTRSNETVLVEFDSVALSLGAASPADDDGNLALAAPDTLIDGAEAGAVAFEISGLDADATATVSVTDGTATVTGTRGTDGTLVLDLSSLADGPLASSLTATDGDGATATVAGPALSLVPAGGDDDGNLALAAPDTEIDGAEMGAVAFEIAGLDADATATVVVTDGTATVTGTRSTDGTLTLDLSSLADGPLATTVTATDSFGSSTTVAGPDLTLDTAPPPPPPPTPIEATFTSGAEGFAYADDAFRGTAEPDYASGALGSGTLQVVLGGGSTKSAVTDISGGWSQAFTSAAGQSGTLTLRYRITLTSDLDEGEWGEVLVDVDGTEYAVALMEATDDDDEVLDSGFVDVTLDLGTLAGGSHVLTLGGFLNQRTRSNETVLVEFDSVALSLGAASPADDDGNLALAAPDTLIDGAEAGAVAFEISGLDADATATVSVTDGTATVTGTRGTDGTLVLDLSSLADGPLASSLTATDGDGATATVAGPALSLVPAGGDDDGNLALAAPDTEIDGAEMGAVAFEIAGLDADATATVVVTDGTATVTGTRSTDGTLTLDLSSLADGPLATTVTATDSFGSSTTVAGPDLTLDTAPPPPPPPTPIEATFTSGAEGFAYADDAFRGTAEPDYASGALGSGTLQVVLGGGSTKSAVTDISGGWSQAFTSAAGQSGTLTLRYRITLTSDLDEGEWGEVLVDVDGTEYAVALMEATDDDDEVLDSGFVDVTLDLGTLAGGSHVLTLGGFLNQRTRSNETVLVEFDSVALSLGAASPADDDGNLALAAPDTLIDGAEAGAVAFEISGLDADATATVSVTDGTATVTGTRGTDGTLVLDLSSLADGPLASSLTATDGDGATATVAGPALSLVPAGGDDDGNLALAAPDTEIDGAEMGAVAFEIAGLDADATATVVVTDGTATVTGTRSTDGTLTLDLSSLADGPLATTVTATDSFGSSTTVAGPDLTLDRTPVALSFADETRALVIDLEAGWSAQAARVLPIGDSLTHGYSGGTDQDTLDNRALQEGYRGDLFEGLLAAGAFVDYVGAYASGPDWLIDQDHTGAPSREFRQLVNSSTEEYHFRTNVIDTDADVVLLMAGTNDFSHTGSSFYTSNFPGIMNQVTKAVNHFFALPGADEKHLVISTIPPKLKQGDAFVSEIVNEGFSTVDGSPVIGDAGNGTYQPGIKAIVTALMADHPTLHLHDAPFDTSGVGPDLVHLTDDAYAAYAASLQALLADEIGLSGGTIDGTTQSFGLATEVEGGAAGDWILGTAAGDLIRGGGGNDIVDGRGGDDTIEGQDGRDRIAGGAGADQVAGGADADTFVYNTDFADGTSAADAILDFGLGADRLVLADAFEGAVTVTDIAGGVRLAVGGFGTIEVFGAQADALKGADLGGGSFALTTDADLVTYFAESMLSL